LNETGEWPTDINEFTIIALKKKTKATKGSDHRKVSFVARTAKIEESLKGKSRKYLEKDILDLGKKMRL
jgi:hypothetical protein